MIVNDRMSFAQLDFLGQTTIAARGAGNIFGPGHFSSSAFTTGRGPSGMYDPEGEDEFLAPGGAAGQKGTTMVQTNLPPGIGPVAPGVRVRSRGAGAGMRKGKKAQGTPVAPVEGIM